MPSQRPLGITILAILIALFLLSETFNVVLSAFHYIAGAGLVASPLALAYNIIISFVSAILIYGLVKGGKRGGWYLALAFVTVQGAYLVIINIITTPIATPYLPTAVIAAIVLLILDYYLTRPDVKDWLTNKTAVATVTSTTKDTSKINSAVWIISGILGTCSLLTVMLFGFHLSGLQTNQIENYEIAQVHSNPLALGGTNLPFQQQMDQLNSLTESFTLGYILLSGLIAVFTYYKFIKNSKGPPKQAFVALFTFTACAAVSFVIGLLLTYIYFKRANLL